MDEKAKIERVIEAFTEYINNRDAVDIAYTRKGRYLYLLYGTEPEEIRSGEWLCEHFLRDIEYELQYEFRLDTEVTPKEYYPLLRDRMQNYMAKLPEYQYLLKKYE